MYMHIMTDEAGRYALGSCTCLRIRKAARRITQIYDHALAPSGLGAAQFSLLAHLRWHDGLSIVELAEMMGMDRTTLTRNLKPLEAQGLAAVGPGPDRRSKAVRLTAEGRDALRRAAPLWREAQDRVEATLGEPTVAELHRLLDRSIDTLPSG